MNTPKESISQAFVNFQGEVQPIGKSKQVSFGKTRYTYAELSDIATAIQPVLHKHGLAWRQVTTTTPDMISVQTILMHKSGETMDFGVFSLAITDRDPQKMGSLLSYCRRYSLMMIGITVIDEDTDAVDHTPNSSEKKIMRIKKENNVEKRDKSVLDTDLLHKQREKAQVALMTLCKKNSIEDGIRKRIIKRETGKDSATQLDIEELRHVYRVIRDGVANTGG